MAGPVTDIAATALLIVDLQNDFIHPCGAYAKGGAASPQAQALPEKLRPLVERFRTKGGLVAATQFTLVPGRGGEPLISPHLQQMRPFLKRGDFLPGGWGHEVVEELQPIDVGVEKITYSAFYQTRLEWLLRKLGIQHLVVAGIVTNGGVASTVRDAHVRDLDVTVLEDGCAAPTPAMHGEAIAALKPVARIATIATVLAEVEAL
ncbi:cysteine hydrolase family protein [Bosea sp. (in: a-proteobacteria)]|uniref:cysteine hydrolase family protein n=1 Tax=Bosea sp. (in: a-proteobacteria) TaxID=1871050 RepID=UPI003B3B7B5B